MKIEQWDEERDGPLTEDEIRRRHQPATAYRISRYAYPPATRFGGTARAGKRFVLSGNCTFAGKDWSAELSKGSSAELPEGEYEFETSEGVTFVAVWLLPPQFRQ